MNLLLLLSALLSALTGVSAAVRAPQMAQTVAGTPASQAQAAPRPIVRRTHPVQSPPLVEAVAVTAGTPLALPAGQPLWTSRRRE
jgi:hypothetical protein